MTKRIQNAIDIFLDAINNGTLAKGTCIACAVGNLVAAGMGGVIKVDEEGLRCSKENHHWGMLFTTCGGEQDFDQNCLINSSVLKNLESTEFTLDELMKIEYAFERNTKLEWVFYGLYSKNEIREDQIKGLEAVVKVMLEFDEQVDDVREVFTNKAELISI